MGKKQQKKRSRIQSTSSLEGEICVTCNKVAEDEAVECQWCAKWQHIKCANLSKSEYDLLSNCSDQIVFFCSVCIPQHLKNSVEVETLNLL